MTDAPFPVHSEHFARVGSTNDVVRGWLAAGMPEVSLATADEQTAGRGREGRTWIGPAGRSLLLSLGFRPSWLEPAATWQLAAVVALAMAEAAESSAELAPGTVALKWPNDLVTEAPDGTVRKLAGVLGESDGLGGDDPRVVVGIGINVDWPRAEFPAELAATMTSLREAAGDRPVDRATLLRAFLDRLGAAVEELRAGRFRADDWASRQVTTGRSIRLELPDGGLEHVLALGVDRWTGGLVLRDLDDPTGERTIHSAEIHHVRLAGRTPIAARV